MYLVINLAVADMFAGGYGGALNFFYTGPLCNFWQTNLPSLGLWHSVLYGVYNTFILTSIINLAVISLERLHATFRPFKHRFIKKWVFGVIQLRSVGLQLDYWLLNVLFFLHRKMKACKSSPSMYLPFYSGLFPYLLSLFLTSPLLPRFLVELVLSTMVQPEKENLPRHCSL